MREEEPFIVMRNLLLKKRWPDGAVKKQGFI